MADPNKVDPIHQFQITNIVSFGDGGISFTNSALFMVLTVGVIAGYLILSTQKRSLVPNRVQLVSEMLYEFSSSAANNGSGFEGLGDNTPFWNIACGLVMLVSRYIPIIAPLALAGFLARKPAAPETDSDSAHRNAH